MFLTVLALMILLSVSVYLLINKNKNDKNNSDLEKDIYRFRIGDEDIVVKKEELKSGYELDKAMERIEEELKWKNHVCSDECKNKEVYHVRGGIGNPRLMSFNVQDEFFCSGYAEFLRRKGTYEQEYKKRKEKELEENGQENP